MAEKRSERFRKIDELSKQGPADGSAVAFPPPGRLLFEAGLGSRFL